MCDIDSDEVTHVVVANGVEAMNIPPTIPSRVHIVKQQVRIRRLLVEWTEILLSFILVVLGKYSN